MELEHHHPEPHDTFGKMIGIQAAILAMLLSVFTILSNQTNTKTIILVNESNDQWSYYQAKKIRDYQLELNIKLLELMAPSNALTTKTLGQYSQERGKYKQDLADIKAQAENTVKEGEIAHHKTSYFELAEGLLEISLILSSLYFISKKRFFPILGLLLGLSGCLIGVVGLLLH